MSIVASLRSTVTAKLQKTKKLSWQAIVSLSIALLVFGYLFIRAYQGVLELIETGVRFSLDALLLSLLCYLAGVLLSTAVWGDILKRMGVETSYLFHLQVFGISTLARKIPGLVWYAVSRITMYDRRQIPRRPILVGLLAEAVTLSLSGLVAFAIWMSTGLMNFAWLNRYLSFGPMQTTIGLLLAISGIAWVQPILIRRFSRQKQGVVSQGDQSALATRPRPQSQSIPVHFGDSIRWLIGDTAVVGLASGVIFFLLQAIEPGGSMVVAPIPYITILGSFGLSVALGPLLMWAPGDIGVKDGLIYLAVSPLLGGPIAAVFVLVSRLWVTSLEILFGLICGLGFARSTLFPLPIEQANETK